MTVSARCERARGAGKLQRDAALPALPLLTAEKEEKEDIEDEGETVFGLFAFSSYARRGAFRGSCGFVVEPSTLAEAAAAGRFLLRTTLSKKRSAVQSLGKSILSIACVQEATYPPADLALYETSAQRT